MKVLNNLDLNKNQLVNARLQLLASAPGTPVEAQVYYDDTANRVYYWDGSAWVEMSLPTNYKTVLDDATPNNTANKLVKRDGSGNFSAGTITADLTGNAANANALENQNGAYYKARANHTGTQPASTISDFDTQVRTNRLDQLAAPTAPVSLNNQKIISLSDPTADQDAATKAYVDAARSGLDVKQSARVATTGNITLSGAQTIDGIALSNGNRVLVKDQTTASANGIYVVNTSGAWSRATDSDSDAEVTAGMYVFVEEGNTNADSGWVLTTDNPITLGTTGLTFTQFSGAGQIVAGAGLTKIGNTLNVGGTTNRIDVGADSIDIAATYSGQSSINTVGTITSGTWNSANIPVANGGTGGSTAAAARSNLGAVGKYAVDLGNNSAMTFVVNHNLNTRDVVVAVRSNISTGEGILVDWDATDANNVTLRFATTPANNEFRCVVIG